MPSTGRLPPDRPTGGRRPGGSRDWPFHQQLAEVIVPITGRPASWNVKQPDHHLDLALLRQGRQSRAHQPDSRRFCRAGLRRQDPDPARAFWQFAIAYDARNKNFTASCPTSSARRYFRWRRGHLPTNRVPTPISLSVCPLDFQLPGQTACSSSRAPSSPGWPAGARKPGPCNSPSVPVEVGGHRPTD